MELTIEQMRRFVWAVLKDFPREPHYAMNIHYGFISQIKELAEQEGVDLVTKGHNENMRLETVDDKNLRVAFNELGHLGILVFGHDIEHPNLPAIQLTEFGLQCLDSDEIQPYDSDGYLARIKSEVPNLDDVAERYLQESLDCFRRQCLMACTVMLGGATEKIFILLVESLHQAIQDSVTKADFENKAVKQWRLKQKSDRFRLEMERVKCLTTFPRDIRDGLDIWLDGILDLIRRSRNDFGHPSGKTPRKEEAHGLLLLFPTFCKTAYDLMDYFNSNSV